MEKLNDRKITSTVKLKNISSIALIKQLHRIFCLDTARFYIFTVTLVG